MSTKDDNSNRIIETLYNELESFIRSIWELEYEYKVAMARRCFNLCALFAKSEDDKRKNSNIITQNALILNAHEIADYYYRRNRFPRILIFDEILLYGRTMTKVIYTLEELIYKYLTSAYPEANIKRFEIHYSLIESIDIKVYAMAHNSYTVDNLHYLYKVKTQKTIYDDEMMQLTRSISSFITNSNGINSVANTHFLLSIQRKRLNKIIGSKIPTQWKYINPKRGSFSSHNATYYIRYIEINNKTVAQIIQNDGNWLTGFSMIDYLTTEEIINWTEIFYSYFDKRQCYSVLKKTISLHNDYILMEQKAQFILFVLSNLCLYDFIINGLGLSEDCWAEVLREQSDIKKISANFGKLGFIYDELFNLCCDNEFALFIRENCCISELYPNEKKVVSTSIVEERVKTIIQKSSENIFCRAGMLSDIDAYKYGHGFKQYDPLKADQNGITLESFFQMMNDEISHYSDVFLPSNSLKDSIIACALSLTITGITSIIPVLNRDAKRVYISFKAGELSTLSIPNRFICFLPSLSLIERKCWRIDMDEESATKEFVKWLQFEDCDTTEERLLLGELKAIWPQYIEMLYKSHKRIARWNVLWDDIWDYSSDHIHSINLKKKEIFDRQHYYWNKALLFLHLK